MNALIQIPTRLGAEARSANFIPGEDPLDEDGPADMTIAATRRGLTRLALIAAETGARFQREGEGHDPMAWMLAPRRMFGGSSAIDAVLAREDFMRALLLHGLSIGLDAEPGFIDWLAQDDDDDDGYDDCYDGHVATDGAPDSDSDAGGVAGGRGAPRGEPRLFTATLVHEDGSMMLQAFHASICTDAVEATRRLTWRYGPGPAAGAQVVAGFDPTTTFAEALLSPALCDLLRMVAAEPSGPLAAGLDINLEQRFAA